MTDDRQVVIDTFAVQVELKDVWETGVLGKVVAPFLFPPALLGAAIAAAREQDAIAVLLVRRIAMHHDQELLRSGGQSATGCAIQNVQMPVIAHWLTS